MLILNQVRRANHCSLRTEVKVYNGGWLCLLIIHGNQVAAAAGDNYTRLMKNENIIMLSSNEQANLSTISKHCQINLSYNEIYEGLISEFVSKIFIPI
jgi:hypothetical protein